ncbi:MAG: sigma-70 family RNA polymerase sigma factor [Planctomycetota bacterium]
MDTNSSHDFERLLAQAGWLRRLAVGLVGEGAADDVVQETWLAAVRRPPPMDRPLRPWLGRVATNLAINMRRGDRRRTSRESNVHANDIGPSPEEVCEELEAQKLLIEELQKLDEPLRTTVLLRYLREKNATEIGRIQDVSPGTVRWRLKQGLERLRERLDERFGGSRGAWTLVFAPYALPKGSTPPIVAAAQASALPAAVAVSTGLACGALVKLALGGAAAVVILGALWWQPPGGDPHSAIEIESATPSPLRFASNSSAARRDTRASARPSLGRDRGASLARTTRFDRASMADLNIGSDVHPLIKPARVSVRLVDEWGHGVPGSRLAVSKNGGSSAESDAEGQVTLSLIDAKFPDVDTWGEEFRVSRSGYATTLIRATLRRGELVNLGEVTLVHSTLVHGRVVDREGRGLGGAVVSLALALALDESLPAHHIDELFGPLGDDGTVDRMVCDSGGNFRAEVAPCRKLRFWAKHPKTRFGWTEALTFAADRDSFGLEITLEPWRVTDRILGRVLDPTGEPVALARVRCEPSTNSNWTEETQVGADGRFEFAVQTAGPYRITAWAQGGSLGDLSIENVRPENGPILVRLAAKRFMNISLRDQQGQAIERFAWRLMNPEGRTETRSDLQEHAGGEARLALPSRVFRITVLAPGFAAATLGPFHPAAPPADDLVFTLSTAPALSGVVSHLNAPVAGVDVVLLRAAKGRQTINGFPTLVEAEDEGRCVTGVEGQFAFAVPDVGRYYVRVAARGFASRLLGPLELAPFRHSPPLHTTLVRGGAIKGQIIANSPISVVGRIVGINCGDGRPQTLRTDANGRFRFVGLAPGPWQVVLRDVEVDPLTTITQHLWGEPMRISRTCTVSDGKTTFHIIAPDIPLAGSMKH